MFHLQFVTKTVTTEWNKALVCKGFLLFQRDRMVGDKGFEPLTSSM
jgi:hypothetical protein